MKRICSLLLALVLLVGLLPVHAAAAALDNGLVYEVYEDHVEITGYTGTATEVVIPDEIEGLPVTVIFGLRNDNLTAITLPDSLLSIRDNAFFDCERLTELTIPANVTEIGRSVFQGCDNLVNIHVAEENTRYFSVDGVLYDRPYAIYDDPEYVSLKCCPGGKSTLFIPEYVRAIGINALDSTPNLAHIDVASESSYFCAVDGVLYNKQMTELIRYPQMRQGSFDIPDGVQIIKDEAFLWCRELTGITIPDTVTEIEQLSFYGCTSLPEIIIPEGITCISQMAFQHCNSLARIELPGSLEIIEDRAFCDCSSLTEIVIPDRVTQIGPSVFNSCDVLTTVYMPRQLCSLGTWALSYCPSLESVYFSGDAPAFEENAFIESEFSAYYPANNNTWTAEVMQNYGGTVTWLSYIANPFTDVPADSFYYSSVLWALENGITTGASDTSFNPNGQCLRAQVVTFLWRAEGCPEPASTVNPFVDVKESDFYYKAVLWAVEQGITNGSDATHFNPMGVCNRAQVVTFLHRAFGSPAPDSLDLPFTDVPAGAWYEAPIAWAVENGITNGLSATEFGPNAACNRAQVVTFLYRAYN